MEDVLFHISDLPDITRFEPRPHAHLESAAVWAIDRAHLHNYLLPRQCPRVTFYALSSSDPADVDRLMGWSTARYVVAVESCWLPEIARHCLYQYEFSPETFTLLDAGAGYYVSYETVVPHTVRPIPDVLGTLVQHDVELRVMPSLWRLREMVITSTLQFSIVRMRNAQPPSEGYAAYHAL